MIVTKEIIFKFISDNWEYPDAEVRINDIIDVTYRDIDQKVKTIKGRFVELIHSSANTNHEEDLKVEDLLVIDTSKEFQSNENRIILSNIICVEKSI